MFQIQTRIEVIELMDEELAYLDRVLDIPSTEGYGDNPLLIFDMMMLPLPILIVNMNFYFSPILTPIINFHLQPLLAMIILMPLL